MIYKYTLETDQINEIPIPKGSVIIHCHEQNNKACIWARVGSKEMEVRKFICMVTGVEFDSGFYLGTCHLDNGKFVVHILEL